LLLPEEIIVGKQIYIVYDFNELWGGFPKLIILKTEIIDISQGLIHTGWVRSPDPRDMKFKDSWFPEEIQKHGHKTYISASFDKDNWIDEIIQKLNLQKNISKTLYYSSESFMPTEKEFKRIANNSTSKDFQTVCEKKIRWVTIFSHEKEGFAKVDIFPETSEEYEKIENCFKEILNKRRENPV